MDMTPLFRVDAGTSMATPFIAGLVALLLEGDPRLDPPGVKAKLRQASAIPGRAPGTFDPKWGFGLVDANQGELAFRLRACTLKRREERGGRQTGPVYALGGIP